MAIQVRRLREALELVGPAVPRKPTMPVLTHVRLGDGRVVATDLDVAVSIRLPEAEAAVLLPLNAALEFLKYAPGHETARITRQDNRVTIAVGGTETALQSPEAADFPPVPEDSGESEGVLDGDVLVRALLAVLPYSAAEDTRPVLTGISLSTGESVEAAGADGFRLAWEKVPGRLSGPSMVIPGKAVKLLERLWKKGAAPELGGSPDIAQVAMARRLIRLNWGTQRLLLRFGEVSILVNLIQGTFPNYRQLVPPESEPAVTVLAEDAFRALQQVKGVAKEGSGIVRMVWEGEALRLSAKNGETGETVVTMPATCTGPGRTAANIRYLLDYFTEKTGPVTLSATSPSAPIKFQHQGRIHCVMMPMFIQWEGAPTPTAEQEETAPAPEAEGEDESEE